MPMDVFFFLLIVFVGIFFTFSIIIEPIYTFIFNKPVYVHFYPVKKQLAIDEVAILHENFVFYQKLSPKRQSYFCHRVAVFIGNYTFVGRDGLEVTQEMKLKIAATSIMLTFGMRKYIQNVFSVVIVYPDVFLSRSGDYHKGEFNPSARAVVFSWSHFEEGLAYNNDNINLGLHEFAHVVYFNSLRKRRFGSSSIVYSDMLDDVMRYLGDSNNREALLASGYLRDYAYTNKYEFMAVLLEHFFETPEELKEQFPKLYTIVKVMINYREG
ncbi:hypothetical protein DVK85_03185 [Flavobacterium arcticum]|uniref:Zinc-dependent peptidase n=1 Tax=Flavobacterium arcticum TaxID=1784713 RepID=A0A345H9M3_9FLAO|nr:zinc-dependent peptidase [Flavobacterium arcticum]AXG73283.1 hypothetical protein DVK85_03185 [Flavobacterium arcticum]KAF2513078.1 zinc-dependent peptidase [Flavobacterium arcticum]